MSHAPLSYWMRRLTWIWVYLVLFNGSAAAATPTHLCASLLADYGIVGEGCPDPGDGQTVQQRELPSARLTAEILRESHIFFTEGGTALTPDMQAQIVMLGDILNMPILQPACLKLVGHSDVSGSDQQNMRIALARAQKVADLLRPLLTDPGRLRAVEAKGETQTLEGHVPTDPMNRRVEIWARSCVVDAGGSRQSQVGPNG